METSIFSRLKAGWNAFRNRDPTGVYTHNIGPSYSYRQDRKRFSRGNERSIVTSVYNRIAMDAAAISMQHVQLDDEGRYKSTINSGLNNCMTLSANIDQTGRAYMQDLVQSMLDEGVVADVPVETDKDPNLSDSYNIRTMRSGQILDWYPKHVKVRVYNEDSGQKEDVILAKRTVGIIENPLYAVMNEPSSTMQRLIRKLNLLDAIDEQSGSGKLDLIIQLPYSVRSDLRKNQAEQRRNDIIDQLKGPFGIAYTDGTEKIIQLNRPIENNLMKQIEYLTNLLYSQLGITQSIMDGTADDKTMLNYYNRTIEPIVAAIADERKRKFLTKTARTQGQSIMFFRDPFKLVPVNDLAEIGDKLTRNEIATPNEMRQVIGWKPSGDPKADELRNRNISQSAEDIKNSQGPVSEKNLDRTVDGHDATSKLYDPKDSSMTALFGLPIDALMSKQDT